MTRTTLDLDPAVLAAARARARAHGSSIGREISDLARAGLRSTAVEPLVARPPGLVLAPRVAGHVITDEMVADADSDA